MGWLLLLSSKLLATSIVSQELIEEPSGPWFTGPLLTPPAHTIPSGHINYEPYFFINTTTGRYSPHWHPHSRPHFYSVFPYPLVQFGLPAHTDLSISPMLYYNEREGQHAFRFGDFPVTVSYQLVGFHPGRWVPEIRLLLREIFPTGKYQHLNPKKHGTDVSGLGSFQTTLGLAFGRLFNPAGPHFFDVRFYLAYTYLAPVHVQGFNIYGGTFDTRGTVYPGNTLTTLLGLQLSLTRQWVLALDIQNIYGNKTRFSGTQGQLAPEAFSELKAPSADQLSLAPAVEYNFSANLGVIAGVWFTAAGRNSDQFVNGVMAINIYR